MIKLFKLLPLFLLFSIFIGTCYSYAQEAIDSVFVNWNKATVRSLERQLKSKADSSQRSRYENRLFIITGYLDIENVTSINNKSIRYKFLEKILRQQKDDRTSKFYIIEANESGSKVILRNFVVYMNTSNIFDIEFYVNINQEWQKIGECQINSLNLEGELKRYITQPWKGFNEDDIIITKFENGIVQESEYFLYNTLSQTSRIKDLIDIYRKKIAL